jgi:uncharacterized membrane protein
MNRLLNRTAKSARRKVAVTLLGALAVLCAAGYVVYAAANKPDFSVMAAPASQTVTAGQSTSYTVTVSRLNGFTGSVTLAASGLPSGATATWKLSDGTSSNVLPPSLTSAAVTIQTATSTPTGTYNATITGTSGNLAHSTTVKLVVQPASQPNFAVSASPSSQTLNQGDQTSYTVNVTRSGGFSGGVSLSVAGLPSGVTASWSPSSTVPGTSSTATLQLQAAPNADAGSYNLTITGTGAINASTVSRSTAVGLVVAEVQRFQIAGNLGAQLAPGTKAPLDLTLSNPFNFDLQITGVTVTLDDTTSNPGCSGTQNFALTQVPAARYPITLPHGQTKTLSQLGVADSAKPQVQMLNQPWNQDACKGATITLRYSGSARK